MEISRQCLDKDDNEIVRLSLANQDYFLCIMERYEAKLLRYIFRISNNSREEAEDILQEVFIKVYQNLNDFDESLKFSSWIYRITHNQVISSFRKKSVRPEGNKIEMEDTQLHNISSEIDISEDIDNHINRKNLNAALDKIDIKYREVLVLYFFEERDYKEISDILKKPMGTVATLINRAKKKLKEVIISEETKF